MTRERMFSNIDDVATSLYKKLKEVTMEYDAMAATKENTTHACDFFIFSADVIAHD